MLDKSIPYKRILMKRPKGLPIKAYHLPADFKFSYYSSGNENDWVRIETSVNEFEDKEKALQYFHKEFMPFPEELKQRSIFVEDPYGKAIATATAWWKLTDSRRDNILHWVAVSPDYQGRGIGKAVVSQALQRMQHLEGDVDMYLSTQTWSYRAINIYLDAGFEFMEKETFGGYKNEFAEAMPIIKEKLIRS